MFSSDVRNYYSIMFIINYNSNQVLVFMSFSLSSHISQWTFFFFFLSDEPPFAFFTSNLYTTGGVPFMGMLVAVKV